MSIRTAVAKFLGKALRMVLGTKKIVILDGQNIDLSTVEMLALDDVEILGRFGFD